MTDTRKFPPRTRPAQRYDVIWTQRGQKPCKCMFSASEDAEALAVALRKSSNIAVNSIQILEHSGE